MHINTCDLQVVTVSVCLHMFKFVCVCAHVCVHVCVFMCVCVCVCVCVFVWTANTLSELHSLELLNALLTPKKYASKSINVVL